MKKTTKKPRAREEGLIITKKTKGRHPVLPFSAIKKSVLGKDYELSLVFVSNELSRNLNKRYRGKNAPANILTFPLSRKTGEMFINLKRVKDEAPFYDLDYKQFLTLIFIHGLLHLKGLRHNSTMKKEESKWLCKFNVR